ncbi:MAG: hypothetical protein ABSE64_09855 [Vulcanimicrobiaceae bacterium]|jgi:hypothetical protein
MFTARIFLEMRYEPSLLFLANAMKFASTLQKKYPRFNTNLMATSFDLGEGSSITAEPNRMLVVLNLDQATVTRCNELAGELRHTWQSTVDRELPTFTRVGFRVLTAFPSEMTRQELIDVYSAHLFGQDFHKTKDNADFAVNFEQLDGIDGHRLVLGIMNYAELLQRWGFDEDSVEEAGSFFTTDFDYGSSKVSSNGVDHHILLLWNEIQKQNAELGKWIG